MNRKRKRSDVDLAAIKTEVKQEITAEVKQEIAAQVTQDVMSYLSNQGLLVRPPPSRTPSPAHGRKSSCASASNAAANESRLGPNSFQSNSIDLLAEPTQCPLVAIITGYDRVVVAEGRLFPKKFQLESVEIDVDYAIVQVECVHQGYEDYLLQPPHNDDIRTLGEALLQTIQWRRDWILVKHTHETQPTQSQPDETTKSGKSGKGIISTKLLCGANSTPHVTSDATKSVLKEPSAKSSEKECTKLPKDAKVGTMASGRPPKQYKGASKATGASKAVGESVQEQQRQKWNDKYKCGNPFLPSMDLKALGPGCAALHAHYMKDCVNNQHGIAVRFRGIYMLNSSDFEVRLVRYNVLYDLFNFRALDSSLLQCWTLSLILEARAKDIPMGFLDPQVMSLDNINIDRDRVLQYVQKAFTKYTKSEYT